MYADLCDCKYLLIFDLNTLDRYENSVIRFETLATSTLHCTKKDPYSAQNKGLIKMPTESKIYFNE